MTGTKACIPAGGKTNIISLIYGEVWACTYKGSIKEKSSGYGKVMIIKGNDNKLYLLGHLESYGKKVGETVEPGDIVAICGMTGGATGTHLHVEVRKCEKEEIDKTMVLDKDWNQIKEKEEDSSRELKWIGKYENNDPKGPPIFNPFNHEERYNKEVNEETWL